MTTIKAADIRIGDTISYSGARFTVRAIELVGDMLQITPADGRLLQVIWAERDVEVLGARGYKAGQYVHFNQFVAPGVVSLHAGARTRGEWQNGLHCGVKPNVLVQASSPRLVTCPKRCGADALEYARTHGHHS